MSAQSSSATRRSTTAAETNMSLDDTSRPGRPGPDELVPSRYALRVGEIDVLVVSDGVLSLPTGMLAYNADPASLAGWLKDMFLPPEMLDWVLASWGRSRRGTRWRRGWLSVAPADTPLGTAWSAWRPAATG
jgi:hypothetical protein